VNDAEPEGLYERAKEAAENARKVEL